ncbi:helix-hairpin-helix domain-containing protein [Streptomyces sp. NPDC053792]|uniref:helix-hairpin-helix domain-containing protein n=1 Tax=Streptomyces sp. NPDC053792 TaxID=3365716 RepID=UPI0037CF0E4B
MSTHDRSAARPPVVGPNQTCLRPQNLCADRGPALRDLIGHDSLGHKVAGRLASEGITTIEQLRALSHDALARVRNLGAKGAQRLHERGLTGVEGHQVALYLDVAAFRLTAAEASRFAAAVAYIQEQGWVLACAYVDRPSRGQSRPRWPAVAKELESGAVDAVIVWDTEEGRPAVWEGEAARP